MASISGQSTTEGARQGPHSPPKLSGKRTRVRIPSGKLFTAPTVQGTDYTSETWS
jgi:hypothetical protein